ncbi:UxaA family hydrolase [Conexibacter sp. S30A1]|uniref:UxaA family hydrolase n=1 Tax=Conexibacter sp. S30A1 TaxID=2937800 RepID=UPI00200D446C|nr:UxaA family hydrolase [Conexibacter sp. S30A1]
MLTGYPRDNGKWGVRNHVLVLPARAAANRAAELVAQYLPAVVAVAHEWENLPGDPDAGVITRTLAGFGANPNVGAVLLITVDSRDEQLAHELSARGQRVSVVAMSEHGGTVSTAEAARAVASELVMAAAASREPMPISALVVGLECGGSDGWSGITANPALGIASDRLVAEGASTILGEVPELVGAERFLAARAVTPEIGQEIVELINAFEHAVKGLGIDIRGAQPTPGNIAGGLTTIEEKSLGAARKAGTAAISGTLEYAGSPRGTGLYIMDTPGHDIEQMVGFVAGGCQLVAFTTGRGTPTGSPIAPCVKISTNSAVFGNMPGDIDIDAGGIAIGTETLTSVGESIYNALIAAASGVLTCSEVHGHREFAVRRVQ